MIRGLRSSGEGALLVPGTSQEECCIGVVQRSNAPLAHAGERCLLPERGACRSGRRLGRGGRSAHRRTLSWLMRGAARAGSTASPPAPKRCCASCARESKTAALGVRSRVNSRHKTAKNV